MTEELMKPAGRLRIAMVGIYMIATAVVLTYVVFCLFPERLLVNGKLEWDPAFRILWYNAVLKEETRLLLLVMAMGALGSYVHAATSFVSYVGNRSFITSWTWWYVLRPFIGVALAVIFYFVIRGGFLSAGTTAKDVSPFGFAAVAGLVGMFSKQATDKLEEVFSDLFRTRKDAGDHQRGDKLGGNRPVVEMMIPLNQIKAFQLISAEDATPLSDLESMVSDEITRVPVLDKNGALRYMIHQSVLHKFSVAWQGGQPPTLADLADDSNIHALIFDATAFVAESVTAGEAKAAMDALPKCQDVIVTKSGQRDEAVIGWLTNIELEKISRI